MVTTLSPCWYCSGLLRQFGIGTVVIGEARNFEGGHTWVAEHGVPRRPAGRRRVHRDAGRFIAANPELWHEDIGV